MKIDVSLYLSRKGANNSLSTLLSHPMQTKIRVKQIFFISSELSTIFRSKLEQTFVSGLKSDGKRWQPFALNFQFIKN